MTRRQEQLNSRIVELLGPVIQAELRDPRLQGLELTRVQINRDASHAMLYVVSHEADADADEIEAGLMRAKGFFRSILAEMLDLRYTPDLTFRYDHAAEETQRVLDLLDQISADRAAQPPRADEGEDE